MIQWMKDRIFLVKHILHPLSLRFDFCFLLIASSLKERKIEDPRLPFGNLTLHPFELWKYLPYVACRGLLWRAFILGYSVIVEPAILMHFPWNHYGFTPSFSYQSFTNFLNRKIPREIVLLTHKAEACFSPVASLLFSQRFYQNTYTTNIYS